MKLLTGNPAMCVIEWDHLGTVFLDRGLSLTAVCKPAGSDSCGKPDAVTKAPTFMRLGFTR